VLFDVVEVVERLLSGVCLRSIPCLSPASVKESRPDTKPDSTVIFLWRFHRLGEESRRRLPNLQPAIGQVVQGSCRSFLNPFHRFENTVSESRGKHVVSKWCGSKDRPEKFFAWHYCCRMAEGLCSFPYLARYFPSTGRANISDPRARLPVMRSRRIQCCRLDQEQMMLYNKNWLEWQNRKPVIVQRS
jgi:hypothetical protein